GQRRTIADPHCPQNFLCSATSTAQLLHHIRASSEVNEYRYRIATKPNETCDPDHTSRYSISTSAADPLAPILAPPHHFSGQSRGFRWSGLADWIRCGRDSGAQGRGVGSVRLDVVAAVFAHRALERRPVDAGAAANVGKGLVHAGLHALQPADINMRARILHQRGDG